MLPLHPVCCCLQTTGGLGIAKTFFLQSLQGLGSLKEVDGSLVMFDNEGLKTLQGLGPVQQVFARVWIDGNPGLTDLRGLEVVGHRRPASGQKEGDRWHLFSSMWYCRITTRACIHPSGVLQQGLCNMHRDAYMQQCPPLLAVMFMDATWVSVMQPCMYATGHRAQGTSHP